MKIWIHLDNAQLGPFDITELPLERMTADTPVWYEGLPYWEPAGKSAKTAHLFNKEDITVTVEQSKQPEWSETTEPAEASAPHDADNCGAATDDNESSYTSRGSEQTANSYQQRYTDYSRSYAASAKPEDKPQECPATYIIWSVLLTVLCCNPIGIIPIILGVTVSSKYNNYNYEGARRASESTAWWLMITIVTSLIFAPLSMLTAAL